MATLMASEWLIIRATQIERQRIELAAEAAGVDRDEYCRARLLGYFEYPDPPDLEQPGEPERWRSSTVQFKLSDDEYERARAGAKLHDMKLSEYTRFRLMGRPGPPPPPSEKRRR